MTLYDRIGGSYVRTRVADPRLAARIRAALGDDVATVVNVGAGAGSYEPDDLEVTAVEPSAVMIAQRPAGSAPVVQAAAERLPFAGGSFDAAMAVWTVHHWSRPAAGLRELRRVARRRVVVATWDPETRAGFWLAEYLPEIWLRDTARFPSLSLYSQCLGALSVEPLPVPADCTDGFSGAFWARPERYLDRDVQEGISTLAAVDPAALERGLDRLRADLDSGAWHARHGGLLELDELDLGYRILSVG